MRSVMSRTVLAAALLACLDRAAGAAPAPPADEKAEAEARLNAVLEQWAKASDAVVESHFKIRMTSLDRITEESQSTSMEVFVKKPDLMRIDRTDGKGVLTSATVYKDHKVHWFECAQRTHTFYTLPEGFGFPEHPDRYPDGFFSWFQGMLLEQSCWLAFGPPVRDLKACFDLHLAKEDEFWLYLEIKPRKERDRCKFKRIQVVLERKTSWVRRIWLEQPNETTTTFDFERPNAGSEEAVTADSLLKGLPADYKEVDLDDLMKRLNGDDSKPAKP